MKRAVILILAVILGTHAFADIRVNDNSFDFSLDSLAVLEASSYVLFSSAILSASSDDEYVAIKDRYEYFDNLIAQGDTVRAKEIFSEEGLEKYELNAEAVMELDKINVGILVSNLDRPIILVPSDMKYSGLNEREVR
jgi:hypothetical protein